VLPVLLVLLAHSTGLVRAAAAGPF